MPCHESCRVAFPSNAARPPAPIPAGAAPAVSGGAGKLARHGTAWHSPALLPWAARLCSRFQTGSNPADPRLKRASKPLNPEPDGGGAAGGCSWAGSRAHLAGDEAGTVLRPPCSMVPPAHGAFQHSQRCTDTLDHTYPFSPFSNPRAPRRAVFPGIPVPLSQFLPQRWSWHCSGFLGWALKGFSAPSQAL